jgi:DNA-3-methyladenine glycosylase II
MAKDVSAPLRDAILRVGPLPLPRRNDVPLGLYLGRVIIGQQLSPAAARTIWARLETAAAAAKMRLPTYFHAHHSDGIRACGVSRAKLRALIGIAAADAAGGLDPAALARLNHLERSARLRSLPGVGPWTCDMLSIFYFGDGDIWPEGDLAVQRTFKRLIGRRSADRAAARFSPYRSHLALAMWRTVEIERAARKKGG